VAGTSHDTRHSPQHAPSTSTHLGQHRDVSSPLMALPAASDVKRNHSPSASSVASNTQGKLSQIKFMKCGGLYAEIGGMRHFDQMVHSHNAHMVMVTYPVNTYVNVVLLPHIQQGGMSVSITACLQCQQCLNPVPPNGSCPFKCPPCVQYRDRSRCQRRRCYFQTQLFLIKETYRKQVKMSQIKTPTHAIPQSQL
jgi:hypothetical protein